MIRQKYVRNKQFIWKVRLEKLIPNIYMLLMVLLPTRCLEHSLHPVYVLLLKCDVYFYWRWFCFPFVFFENTNVLKNASTTFSSSMMIKLIACIIKIFHVSLFRCMEYFSVALIAKLRFQSTWSAIGYHAVQWSDRFDLEFGVLENGLYSPDRWLCVLTLLAELITKLPET